MNAGDLCGAYLGDNDGTCPQLTCIRAKGHDGPHDNVQGDCELCGTPTMLAPYCIECDMTGRSRSAETLRKQHPEVYEIVARESCRTSPSPKGGG